MTNKQKEYAAIAAGMTIIMIAIFTVMLFIRWFNSKTIQHSVINPKPGIECVVVSTTDGASVDCWRIEK